MRVQYSSHRPIDRFGRAQQINAKDAEAKAAASVAEELVRGRFSREWVKVASYHDTTRRSNFDLTGFGDLKEQPPLDVRLGVYTFMMDNKIWEMADEKLYTALRLADAASGLSHLSIESGQESDQGEDDEA
jgi:hypothetical protein